MPHSAHCTHAVELIIGVVEQRGEAGGAVGANHQREKQHFSQTSVKFQQEFSWGRWKPTKEESNIPVKFQ